MEGPFGGDQRHLPMSTSSYGAVRTAAGLHQPGYFKDDLYATIPQRNGTVGPSSRPPLFRGRSLGDEYAPASGYGSIGSAGLLGQGHSDSGYPVDIYDDR